MKKWQLKKLSDAALKADLQRARDKWKALQDETEKVYQGIASLYAELRKRGVENP